jgi:hypothetical protein
MAKPTNKPISLADSSIEPSETCLMRVRSLILDEWLPQIPAPKHTQFMDELRDEIEDIAKVINKRRTAS